MELFSRFWAKVNKTDTCWLWKGYCGKKGYGIFCINKKLMRVHRVSWTFFNGPIPENLCVCHTCDVRNCVNPEHLWLGTQVENTQDRHRKGRTHVFRGSEHPMAKLSDLDIQKMRKMHGEGIYGNRIARTFSVSKSTVSDVINHKRWSHVI